MWKPNYLFLNQIVGVGSVETIRGSRTLIKFNN